MSTVNLLTDLSKYFEQPFLSNDKNSLPVSFYPILCAALVGLSGIFPLVFIPLDSGQYLHSEEGKRRLNKWLSFALGSMLGDVFFHLLPEAWAENQQRESLQSMNRSASSMTLNQQQIHHQHHHAVSSIGLWTILGLLAFFIIEKIFIQTQSNSSDKEDNKVKADGSMEKASVRVEGYLNLSANVIDNFTHGLAVGGSFLVSNQLGFLTTVCILVHEIPHEISDFVLLLRAGFDRFGAARAQLLTAFGSVIGAVFALTADSVTTGNSKAWILPFTSGGFLYIALVSVTPSLLQETSVKQSLYHIVLVLAGLASMILMSLCAE